MINYDEIKFVEYNGIEGYIELMKNDVEPLNNPKCEGLELYYNGKEIKAVLDYITNLQKENKKLLKKSYSDDVRITKAIEYIKTYKNDYEPYVLSDYNIRELLNILQGSDKDVLD